MSEYRHSGSSHDPYSLDSLFSNDVVRYKCSCDNLRRLYNLYFCRHCMALRCRSCVAHEVDSQYCQHCLEYIPTIDPKFQMNKCASCYQCPSCQHLLTTSVLSTKVEQQHQKDEVITRTCQYVCDFCRWSSRTFTHVGSKLIDDIADFEVPNNERILELISFYKAISQKEKDDKKKRRFHSRSGNTMDLLKKYGIHNTLSPKLLKSLGSRTTYHEKSNSATKPDQEPKSKEELAVEAFKPAEARELDELDKLDEKFYYDKEFVADQVSSIEQRLALVEIQPDRLVDFKPVSKSLSVKRSLRCKECERNLCRSEYSPVSIRFKIQLFAYCHIPELRIRSDVYPIELKEGQFNIIEFTLQNQTRSAVKTKLSQLQEEGDNSVYELVLPKNELNLGAKDDTADYEHVPFNIRPLNEETQVTFQSLFKIGFYIKVKPKKKVDILPIRFNLAHDILLLQNPRENDKIERTTHNVVVEVLLGPVK